MATNKATTKEERRGKREKSKRAITKPGEGRKETFLLSYLLPFIFSFVRVTVTFWG